MKEEKVEAVTDFLFLGSEITVGVDCNHEIRRSLLLGRKAMTNLASLLKSKDITLPTKVCIVKAMVFPVVMYGCDGWTVNKTECQRIDAFELWCWRRLLSGGSEKPGKLEVGGASRHSTGFGALEEGLISS